MITALDTNILLDIFGADPKFGRASAEMLRRCIAEGAVVACEAVWTETAAAFPAKDTFLAAMNTLGAEFSAINQKTSLASGLAWRQYRANGGKRERVAADFLIGAHALVQCDRLLTRDRGFYRKYFEGAPIIDPSSDQ